MSSMKWREKEFQYNDMLCSLFSCQFFSLLHTHYSQFILIEMSLQNMHYREKCRSYVFHSSDSPHFKCRWSFSARCFFWKFVPYKYSCVVGWEVFMAFMHPFTKYASFVKLKSFAFNFSTPFFHLLLKMMIFIRK